MPQPLNTLCLLKNPQSNELGEGCLKSKHRYLFVYDDSSVDHVWDVLYKYANDDELDFTWDDAALLGRVLLLNLSPDEVQGGQGD